MSVCQSCQTLNNPHTLREADADALLTARFPALAELIGNAVADDRCTFCGGPAQAAPAQPLLADPDQCVAIKAT